MLDPLLSFYGQPILPAGYNSAPNDGDEVHGAGYNEPVWPVLFDSFEPLAPIILTEEMIEVFDDCADYVVPARVRIIEIAAEKSLLVVPAESRSMTARAQANRLAIPAEQRKEII